MKEFFRKLFGLNKGAEENTTAPDRRRPSVDEMAKQVRQWLDSAPEHDQTFFRNTPEADLVKYHHTLGRRIRNHFNLWDCPWEPQIVMKGNLEVDVSPEHPDAISAEVIRVVHKSLQ